MHARSTSNGISGSPTLQKFIANELRTLYMLLLRLLLDVVREEERTQDSKHNEELEDDDDPELFTRRSQSSKAIAIEAEGSYEEIWFR